MKCFRVIYHTDDQRRHCETVEALTAADACGAVLRANPAVVTVWVVGG